MTIENTPATDAYEAHIRKHERWNFTVNLLDLTFYNLATSFVFGSTVLSLYASYLTSSAALIGLIPAIQSVGNFLPQLLTARYSEQLERKLPFVQKVSVMERVPYLFVFLGIVLIPDAPRWLAYAILALSLAMATGSGGLGAPAWNAMLAKVVPVRRRGLMFGLSSAAGGLLGVAGAALSRHVLATYPYPTSFGICFALCFAFQVVSWICLSMNREPAKKPNIEAVSITTYWKRLPDVLREHPNFARWLVARSLTILGTMGTAFYVVYARKTFNVDDSFAATLTMAALASQTVSTPLLGWLADRLGHKWLSEVCALVGAAGALLILVAPGGSGCMECHAGEHLWRGVLYPRRASPWSSAIPTMCRPSRRWRTPSRPRPFCWRRYWVVDRRSGRYRVLLPSPWRCSSRVELYALGRARATPRGGVFAGVCL